MTADTFRDIIIRMPGTPKGKGRPRFANGKVYTDRKTQHYETSLAWLARTVHRGPPIEGPVSVRVVANFPIPKSWPKEKQFLARTGQLAHTGKPDADNILKIIDALNGIVWKDDSQIRMASVTKAYSLEPGLIIVVRQDGVW